MAPKGGTLKAAGSTTGGPAISVSVHIAGLERTSDEFKQARKDVNSKLRDALEKAGKREALPQIRSQFGSRTFAATLKVFRDRTTVYVGSSARGSLNRAVGWWDFGGRRPRDSAARVGPHTIVSVLQDRRPLIDRAILEELMQVFDGLEHRP